MNWLKPCKDKQISDEDNNPNNCWRCEVKLKADMKRCPSCRKLTPNEERKSEKWNEQLEHYTDKALEEYARGGTDYLIKKAYEDIKWPMYKILVEKTLPGVHGRVRHVDTKYEGKRTISYALDSLREKKRTHHLVAHESAHADPEVIETIKSKEREELKKAMDDNWQSNNIMRIIKRTQNKQAERREKHQYIDWQDRMKDFEDKLRAKYPQYIYKW